MDFKINKSTAGAYHINSPGYSWANFYITPTGEIFIHSDWGYYCYSWKSFGEDFKSFLMDLGEDYFINKIENNYREMKGPRAKFHKNTETALRHLFSCLKEQLKKESEQAPATEGTILSVEQVIANLERVKDKTLPVYAYDVQEQKAIPVTHVDTGVSDRIDLTCRRDIVDDRFCGNLIGWIMRLQEGEMYDLGNASFEIENGATVVIGFAKIDDMAVVVINKDYYFPVAKMDKTDFDWLFNETTMSKAIKDGDFPVIEVKNLKTV